MLLLGIAFAGLGLSPTLVVVAVFGLVYGCGEGLVVPSLQDRVAEGAAPAVRGTVIAIWVGAVRMGQAAGPALAGALAGLGVPALFVAGGVVAALAAAVVRVTDVARR
jgi:sugar phosphate permease